ncbi:MAG: hypothetical protein WBF40_12865, partial [Methyloceanibacter sp.]
MDCIATIDDVAVPSQESPGRAGGSTGAGNLIRRGMKLATVCYSSITEAFYAWLTRAEPLSRILFGFFLPTLAGNVAGGTVLFAGLSYAQVCARRSISGKVSA